MNSNNTANNTTPGANADTCFDYILSAVNTIYANHLAFIRFLLVGCIIAKMFFNARSLYNNKIFALYFFVLLSGTVLVGCSNLYSLTIDQFSSFEVNQQANANTQSIEVYGIILMDAFLGLMPNLFFSIHQTKLTKASGYITVKFFVLNGIVVACFCIVALLAILLDHLTQQTSTDVILLLEYFYGFFFHVLVLYKLHDMEGRVQKVIRRFFSYYCVYGVIIIIRNSTILYYENVKFTYLGAWNEYWTAAAFASVQCTVIILYLRDIKFTTKEKNKSGSSKGSSKGSSGGGSSTGSSTTPAATGSNQ